MNAIRFADATKSFINLAGLPAKDLLPLIPPGAEIAEESNVQDFQIGKIPGRYGGGKWYGLTGQWPTFGLSERDQNFAANWPTHNVGLRAAEWPGIDIDVNSKEVLQIVERLIDTMLGAAPVRERGNAPRALYVFRREGDAPIRKTRLQFLDDKNIQHLVEVLGYGQQYVINGMHPSGVAYEWRPKRDLITYKSSALTPVTAEKIADFMAVLEQDIIDRGWKIVSSMKPRYGAGSEGHGFLVSALEPIASKELVLKALYTLRNDVDQFPTREKFLSLTSSFKHALGKDAEAAYPEFVNWATNCGWADDDYVQKVWDSLPTTRTSPDHLFGLARRRGFRGDAVLDFAGMETSSEAGQRAEATMDEAKLQQREEAARIKAIADKVFYWAEEGSWVVRGTGAILSHAAFNNFPGLGLEIAPAGSSGVKTAANIILNTKPSIVRCVSGVTYLAGKPEMVEWETDGRKGTFYNRWHPIHHALPDSVTEADVHQWLTHVNLVISNDSERELFLDYLAFLVQQRGRKVRYAPIIIGKQGTGKDMMLKPLVWFFAHNATEVSPEKLQATFNEFLERELVVVNEMMRFDKTETYNAIKTLISGSTTDTIMVERKFKNPYAVPNNVNFIFLSNHVDAVRLEEDDRRFFVITSDMEKQNDDYYEALNNAFYHQQSGLRKVVRWLMQRDISKFRPDSAPMDTEGKQRMKEAQRPDYQLAILKQLAEGVDKSRTVMTALDLYERVTGDFNYPMDQRQRAKISTVSKIAETLKAAGWTLTRQVRLREDANPTRVWVRSAEMAELPASELKQKYLEETSTRGKKSAAIDFAA
jgi:hypothetical protein